MHYFNVGLQALPYALNAFEITLNFAGYCPKLVPSSSELRCAYGLIQVIGSIACEVIGIYGTLLLHALGQTHRFNFRKFMDMNFFEFVPHGICNILRAFLERELKYSMIFYDLFFERFGYF